MVTKSIKRLFGSYARLWPLVMLLCSIIHVPLCKGAEHPVELATAIQAKPASARGFFHIPSGQPALTPENSMALERTLSIIKPDAVAKNVIGEIYARFEKAGLKVVAAKYKQLSRREAEGFYAVHRERPFFNALVEFMISGPVMIQALEGENAVLAHRDLLGATNPKDAAPGTIRADFADSIDANAAHGSDSVENAANEVAYFFAATEVVSR